MADRDPQPTPPAVGPAPGSVVAGFRVQERLGEGGMGVVHRALGPDGRPAAIKFLVASGPSGKEAARRFAREAEVRIPHPNICRVLDSGRADDGTPWIAMELLEGESLEARLARGPLTPTETVGLAVQVCRGLSAAHGAGIVHRDLKPSNLFLCRDGTVKLFDFGIALFWSGEATRLTTAGMILGTPWYLSPEQARGQQDLDARTDVWSLGVALWEALVGRSPFARETPLASVVAVLMEDPPPLAAVAPAVPPPLAAVVERAMRKLRDERWPSAAAFGEALLAADSSTSATTALPAPLVSRSIPPGEQRVVAVLLAQGVRDGGVIERAVQEQGGLFMPLLGGRALGLFGGEAWEGDEVRRAAAAAAAARPAAARIAVSSGRAAQSGAGIAGSVLKAAEAGCALGAAGVAVEIDAARGLGRAFPLRELAEGFAEIALELPARDSSPRPEEEGPSATLGRQAELAQLRQGIERALDERRAVVLLVTGPPGIGKSRLRRETARLAAAAAPNAWVLTGRGESLRRETAFALAVSAIREHAQVGAAQHGWPRLEPGASPGERRSAVMRLALEAVGERGAPDWVGTLGELLGVDADEPSVGPGGVQRDPQLVRDRFRMALLDYFGALAERAPLVLLLEDLQWADSASVEVLEDLVDRLSDRALLVVATARQELLESGREPFAGLDVTRIPLRGLGTADVARMAGAIAGRSLSDALVRAIADRTAGNPLFVREIMLELREQGVPEGEVESLPLPLTVEAAVQSRLDHLLPSEKDLCKRASVLGRPFATAEVTALGAGDAERVLDSLVRKEVVTTRGRGRGAGGRDWQFRSALVADVAYRLLSDELRAELHRRAASHLATAPQVEPEETATHFERGGDGPQAAKWYRTAALSAAARGDSVTVVRCAEKALRFGVPAERRFELHRDYAIALGYLGRREEQARQLVAAIPAAPTEGDRARALTEQADLLWRTGKPEDGLGVLTLAVEAARRAGDADALARAKGWQVAVLASAGRIAAARQALVEAHTAAGAGVSPQTRAFLASQRALLAAVVGDHAERRDAYQSAVELFRQTGDLRRAAGAVANLADASNRIGAYVEATTALQAAVEGCCRVGHRVREGYARCNLGYSLGMLGRTAEALVSLDQAEQLAQSAHDSRLSTVVRIYRARALLQAGSLAEARAEADRASAEAESVGSPPLIVLALTVAARARLQAGDAISALPHSTRAMALRDELGTIEEDEAEVFLVHARVLAGCGRREEARAAQARGRERLWEVAGRIGDLGWRARFLRDVEAHRALVESEDL